MPLIYLVDENLRGLLWRYIRRHNAVGAYALDALRVGDPSDLALGSDDSSILRWAEREGRILISRDERTLPAHLANHLAHGHRSPGVFLTRHVAIAEIVEFLVCAAYASEGGSVGTSVAQTIQERREQFHTLRLNEKLDALNPTVTRFFRQGQAFFLQHTGDPPRSQKMALQVLAQARDQQASSLAYFDVFWSSAAIAAVLIFLVLLIRRSVAEKGTHIAAE